MQHSVRVPDIPCDIIRGHRELSMSTHYITRDNKFKSVRWGVIFADLFKDWTNTKIPSHIKPPLLYIFGLFQTGNS